MSDASQNAPEKWTRRHVLASATAASVTMLSGATAFAGNTSQEASATLPKVPADFKITKKRIRQSVMGWCFNPMPVPELIQHCVDVGVEAIEGVDPKFYPEARAKGLKIALVSSHGFAKGPVDPANHEECIQKLK